MEIKDDFWQQMCHKNSDWFWALGDDTTVIELNSNSSVNCLLVKEAMERDSIPVVYY